MPLKNYKLALHKYSFRCINVSGIKDWWDDFSKKTHPLLLWGGLLIISVAGYLAVLYVASLVFPAAPAWPFRGGEPQLNDNQTTMLFVIQPLAFVSSGSCSWGRCSSSSTMPSTASSSGTCP